MQLFVDELLSFYGYNGQVEILNNTFIGNQASEGHGGALHAGFIS